jgi:hypothetical protein
MLLTAVATEVVFACVLLHEESVDILQKNFKLSEAVRNRYHLNRWRQVWRALRHELAERRGTEKGFELTVSLILIFELERSQVQKRCWIALFLKI